MYSRREERGEKEEKKKEKKEREKREEEEEKEKIEPERESQASDRERQKQKFREPAEGSGRSDWPVGSPVAGTMTNSAPGLHREWKNFTW